MTVKELIERLQNSVDHGQNPEAEVLAWDPDSEDWYPVSCLALSKDDVRIYTDEL